MRTLLVIPLALVVGCKSEQTIRKTDAQVEVNPTLLDFGSVAVGEPFVDSLQVDHLAGGTVSIETVSITPISGDWFRYDGEEDLFLDRGGMLSIPLTYEPLDVGYHEATITVTHSGLDSPSVVHVRGHGVVPQASISPLALDFGPVDPGEVVTQEVTVTNEGDVSLFIADGVFTNARYALDTPLPVTLGPGEAHVVSVRFTPDDLDTELGTLTLQAGQVTLPRVAMRANDCANGIASAYDVDGDGVTTCAGDCDDDDAGVRPGIPELADGIDQDCDGLVDEGTVVYDDDGDGYCEDVACTDGSIPGDCNDGDVAVNPGEGELPLNGVDDDCDGVVDSGTTDNDGDGYDPILGGDCDDADPTSYPGAPELEDSVDNDCDLAVDEGTSWVDDDGDGFCEAVACGDGSLPDDCDDTDPVVFPGASELADWVDNNCDGVVDEGTANFDDDGDGYTENGGDCDDGDPTLNPGLGTC